MGIPDHLTCLLRNLYAGQEARVRTRCGTTDWFQIGKGVCQGCILSPCLSNLYAEYIMWNARLDKGQAGIKIAGRNIKNLRYADDTTLMAESEEELKTSFFSAECVVGSHSLLQGVFPNQGLNPGLLHWRRSLHQLSHLGSPRILQCVTYPFSSRASWPRNQTRVSCIAGGFFTW